MAQPTLSVKDSTGATVLVNTINNNGQATMANSQPVVLASDQGAVTVTSTTIALETGGNLAALNVKTPALGQALAAASVPVVLTALQVTALSPPAAITGFALETGGNLGTIVTKLNGGLPTTLGQAAAASSLAVVLANEDVQDLYFTGQAAQTATVSNIIPGTVSANATDLTGYRSGYVQIICPAGTYTTGAIIFEGANDSASGTNFQTIPVFNHLTGAAITAAITLVSSTGICYTFPIQFRYIRVRISTGVTGASASVQAISKFSQTTWVSPFVTQPAGANLNVTLSSGTVSSIGTSVTPGTAATNLGKAKANAAGATDTGVTLVIQRTDAPIPQSATGNYVLLQADSVGALNVHQVEKVLKTYSASVNAAPAAAATDIFTITGNATTTVYITKVIISGSETTFGLVDTSLIKRSTVDTGGTSAGVTATPNDSNNAAASATLLSYTANPTGLGTPVGSPIRRGYLPYASLTSTINPTVIFEFGDKGQPVVLRGIAQQLAVNLNAATLTGGAITIVVEWYEI